MIQLHTQVNTINQMGSTTRVVTSFEQLDALAPHWNALLARSFNPTIFLSYEWVMIWARTYLRNGQLRIITVYDKEQLVAVAPLWLDRRACLGIPCLRVLRLAGSNEVCGDYLDLIVQPKGHSRWVESIWRTLRGPLGNEWDAFEFAHVPSESRTLTLLMDFVHRDDNCLAPRMYNSDVCPYLNLPDTPQDVMANLSGTRRYAVNRARRMLGTQGELAIRFCETPEQFSRELRRLSEIHMRVWQKRGQPGSFGSRDFFAFHHAFGKELLRQGKLMLATMQAGELYMGALYGFIHESTLYYYTMSVELSDQTRVNAGDVLLVACMEESIRRGCRKFDFLRGDEDYKYRWTHLDSRLVTLHIFNTHWSALFEVARAELQAGLEAIARSLRLYVRTRKQP